MRPEASEIYKNEGNKLEIECTGFGSIAFKYPEDNEDHSVSI